MSWTKNHRVVWLAAGMILGLVVSSLSPTKPLHAVATDRQDTLAICTAAVDNNSEAVFTLDFLTGNLSGALLNQVTQQFTVTFSANCATDLKVEQGKTPKFVMVSGQAAISTRGQWQYGNSVLYVAELTSGNLAAYAIPFGPQMSGSNVKPITVPLQLLTVGPFRAPSGAAGT